MECVIVQVQTIGMLLKKNGSNIMISFQERKERIINTTHIVLIDDSTVYVVDSVEQIGNIVFVNVGNGLLFQDMMVLTLEEAGIAAKLILNINKYLDIK